MIYLPLPQKGKRRIFIDDEIPRFVYTKRSWYERIFTRPWSFWKAYNCRESFKIKRYGDEILVMNSSTYAYLERNIVKMKWDNGKDIYEPSKIDH